MAWPIVLAFALSVGRVFGGGGQPATVASGPVYLNFHGGSDNATVPDNPSLIVDGQLTLEAWVYYSGGTINPRLVEIIDTYTLHVERATGLLTFAMFSRVFPSANGWTAVHDTVPLPRNTWVHVAGTWDGGTMRLFRDGALVGSTAYTGPLYHGGPGDQSLKIGNGWTHIDGLVGGLYDIRISDVARYTDRFDPPLAIEPDDRTVGLWRCDEGVGTIVHDAGPRGNHATIGGASWAERGHETGTAVPPSSWARVKSGHKAATRAYAPAPPGPAHRD